MSIKKIMHKDRHGAQVSIEFGEGGPAAQLVEQFLGGMGVPAMQDIPQEHPGNPKGTDTVPAWLTPGEFVMNAEATRMFEPQIEEMNNAGRAVQREQGGSIPEYKAAGGSIPEFTKPTYSKESPKWLTGSLLDSLMQVESGGNPNAVSPAGARGPYQIMPATAANPGYGVTPISPQDVTDPVKSRQFTEMYLEALAVKYPDATKNEVLQMYNAGPGRVLRANDDNPLPQETLDYPGKIEAAMASDDSVPPVSIDNDYLASVGLSSTPTQEETLRRVLGPSTMDSLDNPPLEIPRTDGPMMEPMRYVTAEQMADRALERRREAKDAGYPGQQAVLDNFTSSFKDIYKPTGWRERDALNEEDVVPAIDPYRLEVDVDAINNPKSEPDNDEATVAGLLDAGKKAKTLTPDVVDEPTAWAKVKGFFEEGFSTVLDKGALSEAATLYLGSRALGYGHEGSLNFVSKRYGKGIEEKIAIANKAVGTYTNDSITKYKDTGNLNDLALIPKMTDQGKPAYFVDPKTGTTYDLRTAKDEKGVVRYLDQEDKVIDTKSMLTAEQYNLRSKTDKDRIRSLIGGMKKTMSAKATAAGTENYDPDAFVNTEEVAEAMAQYSMKFNANTSRTAELTKYVVDGIIKHRSNPNMKDISDRDLTEIMLNKGVVSRVTKDVLKAEEGASATAPAVQSAILEKAFPDIDALGGPVSKGEFLKVLYQFGYNSLTPDDKKRYVKDSGGTHNGFLEYIKQGQATRDQDKWVPAFKSLSENLVKQ